MLQTSLIKEILSYKTSVLFIFFYLYWFYESILFLTFHISLLLTFFLSVIFPPTKVLGAIMILVKTVADLKAHIAEHRKLQGEIL